MLSASSTNFLVKASKRSAAELIYKELNGLFAIYKPPETSTIELIRKLKLTFIKGLNTLPCRPVEKFVKYDLDKKDFYLEDNKADTVEALGYRYISKDFKMSPLHPMDTVDSGVTIFSINDNKRLLDKIESMRLMRVYEIKGRFGVWTEDFTPKGRVVEKATYHHINRSKLDRLMSTIQCTYQREMFKNFGIDLQSQEGYELASKGLLRPKDIRTPPQIYSIRCIEYERPFFKIEVYTINESTLFLRNLIHDIGIRLRTYAVCMQIRRTKYGFVDYDSNDCLAFNEMLEFNPLYESIKSVTPLAFEYIRNFDKTILIGHTKTEENEIRKQIRNDL